MCCRYDIIGVPFASADRRRQTGYVTFAPHRRVGGKRFRPKGPPSPPRAPPNADPRESSRSVTATRNNIRITLFSTFAPPPARRPVVTCVVVPADNVPIVYRTTAEQSFDRRPSGRCGVVLVRRTRRIPSTYPWCTGCPRTWSGYNVLLKAFSFLSVLRKTAVPVPFMVLVVSSNFYRFSFGSGSFRNNNENVLSKHEVPRIAFLGVTFFFKVTLKTDDSHTLC